MILGAHGERIKSQQYYCRKYLNIGIIGRRSIALIRMVDIFMKVTLQKFIENLYVLLAC